VWFVLENETSRRDEMVRDPKSRCRDFWTETRHWALCDETEIQDVTTSQDGLENETLRLRPHPCLYLLKILVILLLWMLRGFVTFFSRCIKMAALAKPKVPIMSTAGAIPFKNEKGRFTTHYRLCFIVMCFCNRGQFDWLGGCPRLVSYYYYYY